MTKQALVDVDVWKEIDFHLLHEVSIILKDEDYYSLAQSFDNLINELGRIKHNQRLAGYGVVPSLLRKD